MIFGSLFIIFSGRRKNFFFWGEGGGGGGGGRRGFGTFTKGWGGGGGIDEGFVQKCWEGTLLLQLCKVVSYVPGVEGQAGYMHIRTSMSHEVCHHSTFLAQVLKLHLQREDISLATPSPPLPQSLPSLRQSLPPPPIPLPSLNNPLPSLTPTPHPSPTHLLLLRGQSSVHHSHHISTSNSHFLIFKSENSHGLFKSHYGSIHDSIPDVICPEFPWTSPEL